MKTTSTLILLLTTIILIPTTAQAKSFESRGCQGVLKTSSQSTKINYSLTYRCKYGLILPSVNEDYFRDQGNRGEVRGILPCAAGEVVKVVALLETVKFNNQGYQEGLRVVARGTERVTCKK